MSHLETPVKEVLRDVTTPASVARMWSRIESRGRVEARAPLRYRFAFAAALVVMAVAVLGFVVGRPAHPAVLVAHAGPLLQSNGAALRGVHAGEHAATLALSDGSTLVLDPSATIEPLESSATTVLLKQSRGTVLYDIKPGGPRRWTIECGVASVEVIGTSFRVERTETALRVEVIRGTVLVRGDRVPDRVAQLTAGMKLEVADPVRQLPATAQPPAAESSGVLPSPAPLAMPSESPRLETARWRELARRGENEAAYAELGSTGVARAARSASVDDLFALADLARLSGHPAEATVPLERILVQHLDDPRASLAAFTLGRVRLDSLNAPAAAARAFEKAIALGLPGGLAEDAYAHLIEARAKAGDQAGAKAALGEYVKRFPSGTRGAELRRWTADP